MERRPGRRALPVTLERGADLVEGRLGSGRLRCQHRASEIEHRRAHAHDLGMLRVDDHAVARGQVTSGRRAAQAVDVDETGTAGAERRAVGILAQLRQRQAEAVHAVEDRRALGQLDATAVDRQPHRLMIRRTREGTRRAPTARRAAQPGRDRRARRAGSPRPAP